MFSHTWVSDVLWPGALAQQWHTCFVIVLARINYHGALKADINYSQLAPFKAEHSLPWHSLEMREHIRDATKASPEWRFCQSTVTRQEYNTPTVMPRANYVCFKWSFLAMDGFPFIYTYSNFVPWKSFKMYSALFMKLHSRRCQCFRYTLVKIIQSRTTALQ